MILLVFQMLRSCAALFVILTHVDFPAHAFIPAEISPIYRRRVGPLEACV